MTIAAAGCWTWFRWKIIRVPFPGRTVEDRVLERITVRNALGRIPIKYRVPLVLHDVGDHTTAEVAEILEISRACAKNA